MPEPVASPLSPDALQQHRAECAFAAFMDCLGLDRTSEHLRETPRRVAAMYLGELFAANGFEFTTFTATNDEMVLVRDIPFSSVCAHHFVPFSGTAAIGYIPGQTMVGLSKLARAVDHFARRPQVQEQLTQEIAAFIAEKLRPRGLGVVLRAEHLCMAIRGVGKPGSMTVTSVLTGAIRDVPQARAEFLTLAVGPR